MNSLFGLGGHLIRGNVAPPVTLLLAAAALAGGLPGARLGAGRFKAETIRRLLSVLLFLGGARLLMTPFL